MRPLLAHKTVAPQKAFNPVAKASETAASSSTTRHIKLLKRPSKLTAFTVTGAVTIIKKKRAGFAAQKPATWLLRPRNFHRAGQRRDSTFLVMPVGGFSAASEHAS